MENILLGLMLGVALFFTLLGGSVLLWMTVQAILDHTRS